MEQPKRGVLSSTVGPSAGDRTEVGLTVAAVWESIERSWYTTVRVSYPVSDIGINSDGGRVHHQASEALLK